MSSSRRSLLLMGAALTASLTLAACGGGTPSGDAVNSDGTISVVASTNVYGDIAKTIGGGHVSVHAIISKEGADPHGYEANAQDKLAVSKARIGIENGGGYDDFFSQLAKGQLASKEILNVTELSGLDNGKDFNEHLWYSMPVMAKVADDLAARFGADLPEQQKLFNDNAAEFKTKLGNLNARLDKIKAAHGGASVAVTEPAPLYLVEQAGLVNKTPLNFSEAVEHGSDAPATAVADMLAMVGSGTLAFLAYNHQTTGPQTDQVKTAAEAAGLPVVDFSETLTAGTGYLAWMSGNIESMELGLAQTPQASSGSGQ